MWRYGKTVWRHHMCNITYLYIQRESRREREYLYACLGARHARGFTRSVICEILHLHSQGLSPLPDEHHHNHISIWCGGLTVFNFSFCGVVVHVKLLCCLFGSTEPVYRAKLDAWHHCVCCRLALSADLLICFVDRLTVIRLTQVRYFHHPPNSDKHVLHLSPSLFLKLLCGDCARGAYTYSFF